MFEIVFATNNVHKINEVQHIVGKNIKIINLTDAGFSGEIPENQITLKGNALEKATFINNKLHCNCFADDTGLEVEVLNGEPGVYSARYAGNNCNSEANIEKLLQKLKGKKNRTAQFKTVIALIINNKQYFFEGIIKGEITETKMGLSGFGYDSIFLPNGLDKTFAQINACEKNNISHRAIAVQKLANFLKKEDF